MLVTHAIPGGRTRPIGNRMLFLAKIEKSSGLASSNGTCFPAFVPV